MDNFGKEGEMKYDLFGVVKGIYCLLAFIFVLWGLTRNPALGWIVSIVVWALLLGWWGYIFWVAWRKEVRDGCKSKQRGQGAC